MLLPLRQRDWRGSGDNDSAVRARFNLASCRLNQSCCCANATKIIRREFQNSNRRTEKILLIADVLIGRDEKIELTGG